MSDEGKPQAVSRWRGWLFGVILVAALAAAIIHWGEVEHFLELAGRANPLWLFVALALQLSTYVSVAFGWRQVLNQAGSPRPMDRLVRIALSKLFADQAVPSGGIGGNILLVDQLRALKVERGTASATLLVSIIGYYAAFALCALATLLLLWVRGEASTLLASTVSVFLVIAFGIPGIALWLGREGGSRLSSRVRRVKWLFGIFDTIAATPPGLLLNRRLLLRVALCNLAVFVADSATLWVCLRAVGYPSFFASAFVALIMASVVAVLGPIPMGLGTFEATSIAILRMLGVPFEAGFAATMLLRLFTLWLPMLPGLILIRRLARRRPSS